MFNKTIIAVLLLTVSTFTGYAGYKYGSYISTDNCHKIALSKSFGSLNENTLEFEWNKSFVSKASELMKGAK